MYLWKPEDEKNTFDLHTVTSYCRRAIITMRSWIKLLILQGLQMSATEWRSRGPETKKSGAAWRLQLISAATRLVW